ncbi:hypothetical protein KBY88_12180 [Cyanobium sp. Morenito 9A2]|nr:hypothetical protein [Cyanobium sp. Morenito 9A2]
MVLPASLLASALVLVPGLVLGAMATQARAEDVPLSCRIGQGPWRSCVMTVSAPGVRWRLQVGDERIEFRHDGSGRVTLQRPGARAQLVSGRWIAAQTLCWDGICARGELPLD